MECVQGGCLWNRFQWFQCVALRKLFSLNFYRTYQDRDGTLLFFSLFFFSLSLFYFIFSSQFAVFEGTSSLKAQPVLESPQIPNTVICSQHWTHFMSALAILSAIQNNIPLCFAMIAITVVCPMFVLPLVIIHLLQMWYSAAIIRGMFILLCVLYHFILANQGCFWNANPSLGYQQKHFIALIIGRN